MYQVRLKKSKANSQEFKSNTSYRGESIEAMIRRMKHTKEPIKIGTGMLYTNRADKVNPEYDPRTDKMETLLDASISINKAKAQKLKGKIDLTKDQDKGKEEKGQNSGQAGSTSATETPKN